MILFGWLLYHAHPLMGKFLQMKHSWMAADLGQPRTLNPMIIEVDMVYITYVSLKRNWFMRVLINHPYIQFTGLFTEV